MKTNVFKAIALIAVWAVFVSCGGKRSIWKDIGDSYLIPDNVYENIKKGKYDLNEFSQDGYTVLTAKLPMMNKEQLATCLKAGADAELQDQNGLYPLFVSLNCDNETRMRLLYSIRDFNVKDNEGRNALCYINFTRDDSLKLFLDLVKYGADLNVFDNENKMWPYFEALKKEPSSPELIELSFSDNFVVCPDEAVYANSPANLRESIKLIKEAHDNPFVEFSPENNQNEEQDTLYFMPTLIETGEWAQEEVSKITHYLMCEMTLDSKHYPAGTPVKILDEINNDGYPPIVDNVECFVYKVQIDGNEYELPGRYISMYASEYSTDTADGSGLLLSTFAATKPEIIKYCSFYATYDYMFGEFVILDLVLVKDKVAYSIDVSEVKDHICFENLEVMKNNKYPKMLVIHGHSFSSPVDSYEGFYYLCGNKLKEIVVQDIYWKEECYYDYYYDYDLIRSNGTLALTFEKKQELDFGGYAIVKDAYVLKAPYVWEPIECYSYQEIYDDD